MDQSLCTCMPTPIVNPKELRLCHMLVGRTFPITLIAGDHWLSYDGSAWWVDADEPATEDEVAALLVKAGGVTTCWCG
ncbi:hypothetical protein FA143_33830 [Pseudomonas aeruginosa]|jgi:hypothetical protein|uniref:Uncharacterized protein n=2 Tax=Pseudomonas aeruginosa TaxID=287 RepID=Q7WXW7_PSEAI|nr:hypothetical protein RL093 [Pseudomonas aeruginosa PA14]ABJ13834.1 hypothetical protein PA14_59170 [Pseudomonas aeruginosa UCBPP-PA14]ALY72141.1 hypothetical protein HW04_14220 [Pseudomonas aeruginosa]EKA40349.1 hypothetical protein PACI27_4916 [Pseudomonas aeruginosa CI27]OFM77721.1 hypothetical protein HMPREF2670_12875 [Pseudomonas sp. HMSC072F09]SAJ33175.1 Uncharacterised protein [Enterobacter cloacae]